MYFAEKYGYAESDKKIGTAQEPLKQNKATEPKKDGGFFASKYGYADERDLKGILPTKPKEQEEKSDDGFIKESFQSLAGGGLDAVEQYARVSRALPGGTETYNLDPNSRSAKAIDWVNKVKQENPDYDLDEKREGLSRWYHEGLRAMVPSIAGGLPGAAAGAAIGTSVGGPVGTFLGGLTGFALGAGGVFGAAEYDSFMEEAQQAGVPEEEAHQMGVLSGLAEGGFEAATDLLQGATLGVGKLATAPAKQALKKGVSELFKMRFGNMLGRSVGGAAIEGTGEAATAATQTQLHKELGMTEMSAMDAAAHAFGPGFMMGLMFTPMVQYSNYQGKKHDAYALAREDTDPEARRKAAERIGKQLGKFDQRAERYWMKYADEAIENKEPVRLDMNYEALNERINNLEESAKYSPKAKENLEILKTQKDLIDEEENQTNQVETAQEGDFQETPETEDYTQTKTTQTLADFDLGQPIEQEQFAEQNNISGSEMEQTTEQPANIDKDTQPELLGTPQMDEQDSTYTNAPIEDIEASQEPVQETSLLDVRDEDLEIIDGTEEELGNYNIVGPSKKPGQGYKKLDAAKKRAQKLQEEGAESYLMKNRDGEYLVISDRKYAEAKEEPVPLRKDQVETEIRTEIGNQFDTLQKRGLIEIVDNETDAKGEPIYANGSDKPAGYYENGKITLISSGIGKGQAYNVFMHEGVHKILDKNPSFSKRKKGLFNEFKNLKDTENIKAAYGVVPKDTPTQNIDEEAFAYFIQNENNRDHSLYRKVVATVKSYLNKLGIPYTKLNDKDIAALAVKQINRDMNKQVSSADRKYSKVAGSDQKQTEYDSNAQTMADVLGQNTPVSQPELPAEPQTPADPTVGMDSQTESLTKPALTFADKPVQTEKTVSVKDTASASSTVVTTSKSIDRSIPKEEARYNQVAAIVEGADNADEVVLFGELNDDQTLPKGLGAWAAQTAIDQRTPVYLFDNKLNKWFTYKKGRKETPEAIEAQKREVNRERGAANTGTYELLEGETLPDKPILKQEEIADGFTESIPPRIPTDNTFVYADSRYIDEGNVKQAISSIESQEANLYNEDGIVPLPPSIDDPVNSPQGKQAQLQENSANAIREMRRDFYRSRGDSEVADNIEAEKMDIEYGNDEVNDLPELTPEQVEQLEDDVPGNKKGAANVADILRDYGKINREDGLSVFEQIEKPKGFEKLRTIGGVKREVRDKFFDGKEDADLTPDEAYVVHQATENIRQTNEKIIKGLYNQMLAAKSNAFLNKKWNDMEPHKDYDSFRNTLRIVTTRDYIASQLVELSKFYDLSTTTDYFAENTFSGLESVPNELLDLYEYRDKIRQIAREEELDIETDKEFAFDEEQAAKQLMSDEFGILLNNLKQTHPDAQRIYGPIFKDLLTDETSEKTVNFFKQRIDPLIEAATEDATDADGNIKFADFVGTEAWLKAKDRLQKRYGLDIFQTKDDRDLLKIAAFIAKDRKFKKVSDLVESKPFETYDTEENYLEKIFPATKEEKKAGKTALERKTDKVKIADRAYEYVDMLMEGMKSWGFKDYRHIKLNVNNAADALIMMKNPALLKDFQKASFEGVFNSLNDNQKKDALRIIENSIPDAKIAKLKKELNKPAGKQNLDGVFGSMQNKLTARDIAGAVKSEYFKGEKGKRFKQFGPYDRIDISRTMLQSMKIVNDIWEKPIFGHGLIAETLEDDNTVHIDSAGPAKIGINEADTAHADNRIGRVEEINTKSTIAYADNYGYVQNFDYNEKAQEVAGLVETLGIASREEIDSTIEILRDAEFKDPARKEAEISIQQWKIALAKRSISSGLFINNGTIEELSKKYRLDKNKVKRTWLTSVDTQDFYRRVDNLIDETHLETAKQNVSAKLGNTDNIIEPDLNKKLTEKFDKKQLEAYYSGKKYVGDRRKAMAVKAAVQLRDEILLRGKGKARIEEIKLSNEQQIEISDVVELREATDFDKQFTKQGAIPVRMLNQDKQAAYEDIAKAFGAELTLISDARFDELTGKPEIRSRYIPATKENPSKFVINIKDKRPFDNLFSDMVADHAINSMTAAQVKRLNGRAKRTSIQNKYGNEFDRTVSEQAEKKGDFFDKNARMDAISELVANVISNKQTLNDIASTYEGRADLAAILKGVTETIDKLDNPISRTRGLDADTIGAFSKYSFEEYRKFIVEMFVDEDVMARGHDYQNMTSTEPRMYSMNGFYSIADAQEMLKQVKQGGKDQVKKITQDNRGTKVAIMDAVEKWLKNAVLWIKEHKPKGFIDDLLADPLDMELASMIQHAGEERLAYLRAGVIAKHKDTFKQFSITELEQLHDRIRRGIRFNGDGSAEKVDNGLDFTKEEDVNKAIEEGISQEVIDAFIDFKKEADRQYQELRKVYPDLPEDPVHYGQSIRWRYKDGRYVNEEFDQVIKPELEGSDYYTKEKDKYRTTAEIAEKYRYESINPTTMLLKYVAETEKIIATRKMLNRAMAEGRAKIFTNPNDAKKAGLHDVNDEAFQNVLNHQTETQYEIELNGNPYLDETGGRIFFKTVAEAEETAKGLDGITSVTKRESLDKALVGWTIYEQGANGLHEIGAVNDMAYAQDIINKMNESGIEATMKPRFEPSQKTTLAQTYFTKDLARMLRTTVSPNRFRNWKLGPINGHRLLQFKHASTAIEFAFSFFHAFTIAQEAMASEMSIRQRRANTLGEKIKASNPFSALGQSLSNATDLKVLIDEVMKNPEMVHNEAIVNKFGEILHVENPDVADMIHHFFNVGGLFKMDKDERHQSHYFGEMRYLKNLPKMEIINGKAEIVKQQFAVKNIPKNFKDVAQTMLESVKETRDELVKQYPDNKVANMFKTAQFAALEGPTAWLMETGIPKLKMATWMKEYSKNLETNREKLLNGEISKMSIAHDTMKFVEDRFGEVNWKNQWMNKGTKDALIFMFRSFTWFTGSWKGVTKAGVDYGKLGWYKLKGEKYELTTKGLWGVNAVIAHFLTAAAVTAVYQAVYGWDDPAPDDEETDLLTKLMFPRHDPQDPHSRLTIPSYVTEAYKIFHHIGLMGDHTEPWKLVSGRFNSFIGNAWEAFDGKSWDGVVVRDNSESLPTQALDSALHIINIAPISISSAFSNAARKGFDPTTTALSLMGMTRAPAVSLHSDAVNKAYQISREQFAGLSKKPGEKKLMEERSRAAYQFGKGNRKPLQDMLKEGRISETQYSNSIKNLRYIDGKKNPRYEDELTSAMKHLTIEDAIEVWHYMSEKEKKDHRVELINKYRNVVKRGTRPRQEIARIRQELKVSGIF